ncbi:MAG: alpha/beta hydrolase, partial [Dorea sp.]
GLNIISVYGSEDKVINMEKYEEYHENLPMDAKEMVIKGGCHALFGDYGAQEGDGEPTITAEEQINATIEFSIESGMKMR